MTRTGSSGNESRPPAAGLSRLLATAWNELRRLQACAGEFAAQGEEAFSPRQVTALCAFLDQAAVNLQGRIVFLGAAAGPNPGDRTSRRAWREKPLRAHSLIGVYRRCCRRLGAALDAAKGVGDATTAWLLADVLHRLERQLWLLDPQSGACRAAVLFYRD